MIVSTDSVPDMIDMALCVIKCLVLCCATLATWADQRDSLVQGVQKIGVFSYVLKSKLIDHQLTDQTGFFWFYPNQTECVEKAKRRITQPFEKSLASTA